MRGSGGEVEVASEDVQYAGKTDPPFENRDGFRRKSGEVKGLGFVGGLWVLQRPRRFRSWGFFFGAGFAAFGGLVEGVERRADFLAGLDAGFVFRFGMGKSLCPGLPEISGR